MRHRVLYACFSVLAATAFVTGCNSLTEPNPIRKEERPVKQQNARNATRGAGEQAQNQQPGATQPQMNAPQQPAPANAPANAPAKAPIQPIEGGGRKPMMQLQRPAAPAADAGSCGG